MGDILDRPPPTAQEKQGGIKLPAELLSAWLSLPASAEVQVRFSRDNWDDLLLGVIATQTALLALRNSVTAVISGDRATASQEVHDATTSLDDSTERLGTLLKAIINQAVEQHG